jgi:hypothetical protein
MADVVKHIVVLLWERLSELGIEPLEDPTRLGTSVVFDPQRHTLIGTGNSVGMGLLKTTGLRLNGAVKDLAQVSLTDQAER